MSPSQALAHVLTGVLYLHAGPYSDVQFMRFVLNLKSVACLPLVVASTRMLGVLRLGFEEMWQWNEQEKVRPLECRG
jgi:hypothetical protein